MPIERIVRRYGRSIANLTASIEIADHMYVYENSVENVEARLCLPTQDGVDPQGVLRAPGVGGSRRHPEFADRREG